jgi:peptide-methionine (R)-S-oxide reductase
MKKRTFLKALVGVVTVPAATLGYRSILAAGNTEMAAIESTGNAMTDQPIEKIELTVAEWKRKLTPAQFDVLRRHGTERPFTSPLNDEKREGTYACAGCDLPLFTSDAKYDSGTGWPSFYQAIPDHIGTSTDYKLILPRTEYHCARCGGHHGHVFKDGPQPTGLRYCNNGVALTFYPA